jgi:hypothetical protein
LQLGLIISSDERRFGVVGCVEQCTTAYVLRAWHVNCMNLHEYLLPTINT